MMPVANQVMNLQVVQLYSRSVVGRNHSRGYDSPPMNAAGRPLKETGGLAQPARSKMALGFNVRARPGRQASTYSRRPLLRPGWRSW